MLLTLTVRIAAFAAATLLLLLPAIWNGFPLLFYDTGAYLGRAFFDSLSPGRSAVYGFFLGAGRWPYFWPVVLVQSFVAAWVVALCLRVHGLGDRPVLLPALFALFTAATSLPWLTGQLMPDAFAGLAVLALYLLAFRAEELTRPERWLLIALIAFSAASHNATLAVITLMLGLGVAAHLLRPHLVARLALTRIAIAAGASVILLLTANFAVTGRIVWTPGGTAFVFSRLVQDGIVHRFLEDNCPDPSCASTAHSSRTMPTIFSGIRGPKDRSPRSAGSTTSPRRCARSRCRASGNIRACISPPRCARRSTSSSPLAPAGASFTMSGTPTRTSRTSPPKPFRPRTRRGNATSN
ncbi:MAG: hypothetical protein IT539_00555 [Bradyrhizobiaceae bacterium]|nr:hypothetical protein [Bradyrhizobiaceae bacterium]